MTTEVLPHEKIMLDKLMEQGLLENASAAEAMSYAINDGNQWHDNSAYDEAIERMKKIDARFAPISKLVSEAVVVDYPTPEDKEVKLGSLVGVNQAGDRYKLLLIGQLSCGTKIYETEWAAQSDEDIYVLSPSSPMGGAISGSKVGDTVTYDLTGHTHTLDVESIDQEWLKNFCDSHVDLTPTIEE